MPSARLLSRPCSPYQVGPLLLQLEVLPVQRFYLPRTIPTNCDEHPLRACFLIPSTVTGDARTHELRWTGASGETGGSGDADFDAESLGPVHLRQHAPVPCPSLRACDLAEAQECSHAQTSVPGRAQGPRARMRAAPTLAERAHTRAAVCRAPSVGPVTPWGFSRSTLLPLLL